MQCKQNQNQDRTLGITTGQSFNWWGIVLESNWKSPARKVGEPLQNCSRDTHSLPQPNMTLEHTIAQPKPTTQKTKSTGYNSKIDSFMRCVFFYLGAFYSCTLWVNRILCCFQVGLKGCEGKKTFVEHITLMLVHSASLSSECCLRASEQCVFPLHSSLPKIFVCETRLIQVACMKFLCKMQLTCFLAFRTAYIQMNLSTSRCRQNTWDLAGFGFAVGWYHSRGVSWHCLCV